MSPQRRTALASVAAAAALLALKLGTDLVAALLTFFAIGIAVRPADPGHQYGHGKAEHLAALAEGALLVLASVFLAFRSLQHLFGSREPDVNAAWWALAV